MIHPENMLSVDRTDWTSLPRSLHILTGTLAAMAIAVLGWSGWQFMDHLPAGGWIILAVFGIATFPFFIYFRRIETMVSIGDAYFMAIAILHGPATCVVATATYALVFLLSIKSFKPFLFVFNFSVLVCDAFAYSMIFQLFKPAELHHFGAYVVPAGMMALVSFLFTSVATAAAVSWRREKRFSSVWLRAHLPLLLNSFIAASAAVCIAALSPHGKFAPLAIAPVIGFLWFWTNRYRVRLDRKEADFG